MGYRKADEILPAELVSKIQEYIDGESIYIPRKKNERRKWGKQTKICRELQERNKAICNEYLNGESIRTIAQKYFLSEKTIQRIIYSSKQ